MSAERTLLTQEQKLYLATTAWKIGDIVFEQFTPDHKSPLDAKPWLQDRRSNNINPLYNQTNNGLFLEVYYGSPSRLWTPWGKWDVGGSGCYTGDQQQKAMEAIFERVEVGIHQEERVSRMGHYGPIQSVLAVDGEPLPEPSLVDDRENYLPYEVAKDEWAQLCAAVGRTANT